jgi:hypothetical protein
MEARPSSSDVQRLIGEVARRHNLLLDASDPIFVTVTLNELLLVRALEQLRAALGAAMAEMALLPVQEREAAKAAAEQLITGAADYVSGEIKTAAREAAVLLRAAAREELARLNTARVEAGHAQTLAWRAALVAVAAAGLTAGVVLAACIFRR